MAVTGTGRGVYINGVTCGQPFHASKITAAGVIGGAASGTAGDENILSVDGQQLEYHILGTSTLIGFQKVATGLRFPIDASTSNDGIEINGGILAQDQLTFTIGTDSAFHIAARFNVSANTLLDVLMVGFRNVEANQTIAAPADMTNYNTSAGIGVYDTATPFTTIYTVTDLDATTYVATDTTDVITAATPFEFRTNVSAAGVVTFQLDIAANANPATAPTLVAPTTTQAFTWTDGDVVTPYIIAVGGNGAGTVDLLKLDIGHDSL
jgi:hypothetical protein